TGKPGVRGLGAALAEDRNKPKLPQVAPAMPEVPPGMKAVLYSEKVRLGMPSTFAAPLRPGARSLPRAVELRFQGRVVFTFVLPIENFPSYTGDWILWYAERAQDPSTSPAAVKAPIPYRKLEAVGQPTLAGKNEARIQ